MPESRSLRRRFIAAYVLLAFVVCGCFALAAYATIKTIENVLIDKRLERASGQVIERFERGLRNDLPNHIDLYVDAEAPAPIRRLSVGIHEVNIDGNATHVLVKAVGSRTFYLVDDESDYESIEVNIYLTLAAAFFGCIGLSVVLGRVAANRIIAPVTELAEAVAQDDPGQQLPSLASQDEIGVLARAFAARTDKLERFLERERWFVGDVSHEMRTPLTVMLGASELLRARLKDMPELSEIAARIQRTAADAAARVTAMLLLSRAPETIETPRVALTPLIEAEIERYRPLLVDKPVSISILAPQEVVVAARPELVGIAIGNLIRNACQCTETGTVKVLLTPTELIVEDTGPGVPAGVRRRLFERFARGEDAQSTGSGLGLAIVRRVSESLGWTVSLFERDGGGSSFVIRFGTQQAKESSK